MRHGGLRTVMRAIPWVVVGLGWLILEPAGAAGEWSLPDSRQGIRTAPLLLLSRPDVQAELRLDQSQVLGAQNMINELTRRAQSLRGKTGAAVMAERRAIDEAEVEWLGKNLTRNQLERLRQIELQWEGASAILSRPTIADHLRLTPEQRQSLARIIAERNAARARPDSGPGNEPEFNRKAQSVLSQTQQEVWVELARNAGPLRQGRWTGQDPGRSDGAGRLSLPRRVESVLGLSSLGCSTSCPARRLRLASLARRRKRKSQNEAPPINVWVRVSSISGLKPSARAKSRWHDRLAPRSARPRARYISAYRQRTTLNDSRSADCSITSSSRAPFSRQRSSVRAKASRLCSPSRRASSAPPSRASSVMTSPRIVDAPSLDPPRRRRPGPRGRRSGPRSHAAGARSASSSHHSWSLASSRPVEVASPESARPDREFRSFPFYQW